MQGVINVVRLLKFLFSLIIGPMDEALLKGKDNDRKAIATLSLRASSNRDPYARDITPQARIRLSV
jgi:hypothetical protein